MPQRTFVETYLRLAAEMRRQISTMPPSRERDLLIRIAADYDHVEEVVRLLSQGNVSGYPTQHRGQAKAIRAPARTLH